MLNIRRIHPGVYIKETLEAMEMTSKEFAARTGISERTLSSIINGNGDITFDVAYKLSLYFDNSVTYWSNLQTQYNVYLKEEENENKIKEEWNLIKSFKKYLIELKLINDNDDYRETVKKCRELVGVNDLQLLTKKDTFVCLKEQHFKNENDSFYQNFWIALALNEARKKKGTPYNKQLLLSYIDEIRRMTIQDYETFYPRLKEILSECGISFVLLPYLSKSNIYGATKWFNKDSVMLAISNRGEKADLFWFTLFHEISHVLMEHRREALINMKDTIDIEADKMAADMLIPFDQWKRFISYKDYSKESINKFAKRIGIHPCIVLGRLHKEKVIPYDTYNKAFNLSYKISFS